MEAFILVLALILFFAFDFINFFTLEKYLNPKISLWLELFKSSKNFDHSWWSYLLVSCNVCFNKSVYRTRAIISRGLYIFYPISKDHSCTVTFGLMNGLYSRAAYDGARTANEKIEQQNQDCTLTSRTSEQITHD